LLLATAVLGLLWNLCALPAYELPKLGVQRSFAALNLVGFAALGFLPGVVVHSVLRGQHDTGAGRSRMALVGAAYSVSTVAVVFHVAAWWNGTAVPSPVGMRLLT
jgi:hypothetical protein